MKSEDTLIVATPDGQWRMRLKTTDAARPSGLDRASAVGLIAALTRLKARSRDALLTSPTAAESAANTKRVAELVGMDLGTCWVGDLRPLGKAIAAVKSELALIDKARRGDALSAAVMDIASYGAEPGNTLASNEASPGGFGGTLAFMGGVKPNLATSDGARAEREMNRRVVDSINAKAREYWGQKPILG